MIKENNGRKLFVLCNNLFMLFLITVTLYPMLYVAFASLSNPNLLMGHRGLLLYPLEFNLNSYQVVFRNKFILTGYANTIIVVVSSLFLNLFMTTLGSYFYSRKNVMLQKALMKMIVFTMFFSGGIIPTYLMYKQLGFENNLLVLILPGATNATSIIILRTAFYSIPRSLEESATIDGAGHFQIIKNVLVPLSLPTLSVIALNSIVGHWNAWFNASIYLRDKSLWPLQLILREILIQGTTNDMGEFGDVGDRFMIAETIKYAIIIVATLPVLCSYPFLQKYFIKGAMIGAVKE